MNSPKNSHVSKDRDPLRAPTWKKILKKYVDVGAVQGASHLSEGDLQHLTGELETAAAGLRRQTFVVLILMGGSTLGLLALAFVTNTAVLKILSLVAAVAWIIAGMTVAKQAERLGEINTLLGIARNGTAETAEHAFRAALHEDKR